jgi:hypothetical protein
MRIPTQNAAVEIETGQTGAMGRASAPETTILGGGIRDLGAGVASLAGSLESLNRHNDAILERQANALKIKEEHQRTQDISLEVATKYSQLRTDWTDRMREYADNPTDNLIATAGKEFDDYFNTMLQGSSSPEVRDSLSLKGKEFKIGFIDDAYRLQTQYRAKTFAAGFDLLINNAENTIYKSKSVDELYQQKAIITGAVSDAVKTGRIKDPETIQALMDKANRLDVAWGEALVHRQ